jgi:hypothetical protein
MSPEQAKGKRVDKRAEPRSRPPPASQDPFPSLLPAGHRRAETPTPPRRLSRLPQTEASQAVGLRLRKIRFLMIANRENWVFRNCGYMLCLIAYKSAVRPVIEAGNVKSLWILLFLLFLDIITSRSFGGIIKATD